MSETLDKEEVENIFSWVLEDIRDIATHDEFDSLPADISYNIGAIEQDLETSIDKIQGGDLDA